MSKKQIIIYNKVTGKAKVFNVKGSQLDEAINFIKYNNGVLKKDFYNFENPISFQIIDLYLSPISTPQPLSSIA